MRVISFPPRKQWLVEMGTIPHVVPMKNAKATRSKSMMVLESILPHVKNLKYDKITKKKAELRKTQVEILKKKKKRHENRLQGRRATKRYEK